MSQEPKIDISRVRETVFNLVRIADFLVEAVDHSINTEEPIDLDHLRTALVEHRKNLISVVEAFNPTPEAPPEGILTSFEDDKPIGDDD